MEYLESMPDRIFGHIEGQPPGTWFASRADLHEAGVHRPTQAGISGSEKEGADSIVLSGGYEDDEDHGEWILYTGQGGRDSVSGVQVEDQLLNRGNLALAKSCLLGLPVRVIRGYGSDSSWAPDEGYSYDGLYRVEEYWRHLGERGHYVWRYRLRRIDDEQGSYFAEEQEEYQLPERVQQSTVRVIRDTEQARRIKKLYAYRCQVCGVRLEGTSGPYAEAAHIKPLGQPHNGPDVPENLLCLCPNHHVLFDYGGFSIDNDLSLIGLNGSLIMHEQHELDPDFLQYHRDHYLREHPER